MVCKLAQFKCFKAIGFGLVILSLSSAEIEAADAHSVEIKTPESPISTPISPIASDFYPAERARFWEKLKSFCSDSSDTDDSEGRIYQENLCSIAEQGLEAADSIAIENDLAATNYLNGFDRGFFDAFSVTVNYYNDLIDLLGE